MSLVLDRTFTVASLQGSHGGGEGTFYDVVLCSRQRGRFGGRRPRSRSKASRAVASMLGGRLGGRRPRRRSKASRAVVSVRFGGLRFSTSLQGVEGGGKYTALILGCTAVLAGLSVLSSTSLQGGEGGAGAIPTNSTNEIKINAQNRARFTHTTRESECRHVRPQTRLLFLRIFSCRVLRKLVHCHTSTVGCN